MTTIKYLLSSAIFITTFSTGFGQSVEWVAEANPSGLQTNGVGYTADGSTIVSGTNCHPANVRTFNANSGLQQWNYTVPTSLFCIMGVGISSNGKYLAAVEEFGNLIIFDYSVSPPDSINTISTGSRYAFSMDFSPDSKKIAIGGADGKLIVYDLINDSIINTINAHSHWVTTVQFDHTGKYIISGGNDGKVKVWNNAGNLIHNLSTLSGSSISKVLTDTSGSVYASERERITKWNLQTGTLEHSTKITTGLINAFDLNYNQNQIVAVSTDNIIKVLSSADLTTLASFKHDTSGVGFSLACSPTKDQIVVGTTIGEAVCYSLKNYVSLGEISEQIKVASFPNPFDSELQILNPTEGNIELLVFNMLGAEVYRTTTNKSQLMLPLANLKQGIYFLNIYYDQKLIGRQKVLKK